MSTHGFSSDRREDLMAALNDEVPANLEAQLENVEDKNNDSAVHPNPHNCDCDGVCDTLHYARLPHDVRDQHKYLSYENFPVLCRDAAAILLPPGGKVQKKYVCKQVFDCCRKCNWLFYVCLKVSGNTYGFCMRGAYKCMCDCIDKKSNNELPYNPAPRH
ncbi:hypothetical protein ACROYT_G031584 [Oculina patagonica]